MNNLARQFSDKENKDYLCLNYKVNTCIFTKESADLNRISYLNANTLLRHRMFNGSWKVIKYRENKTMTYIQCKSECEEEFNFTDEDETIYISPSISHILQIPFNDNTSSSSVEIYDLYDEMLISQIKFTYNYSSEFKVIHNLPIVKKLKLKMFKEYDESVRQKIIELLKRERVVSLNEIITLQDDDLILDPFYGILTDKNDFYHFAVSEIEYEEYDSLRNYLNINERQVINSFNTSGSKNLVYSLNAFLIPNDNLHLAEVEVVNNDYSEPMIVPKQTLRFYNNLQIKSLNYSELLNSEINYLNNIHSSLRSNIEKCSTIFLTGPIHSGVNYALRNICDELGINYKKKDMNKFRSGEKLINYMKKLEFSTPCVVNFKNCRKMTQMLTSNSNPSSSDSKNILNEIRDIINIRRNNTNLIFIFSFENATEVDNNLKILSDVNIEHNLPDIKTRMDLFKVGLRNVYCNVDRVFNKKMGKKINKILKESNVTDLIGKINFFEVAKLTVGFDIKEIKFFIKSLFEDFCINKNNSESHQSNSRFDNVLIKTTFEKIKKSRLKSEKTISSIPEVKWEDVGGLENAKEDINDTIQLPLKYPKLFQNSLKRRSGLLLFGPPGSGKTLLAKAIANECSSNFISVKGPELLNMYVGESEKNIREVFERARSNRPCALFFDEIDALAPARTKNSDQNNVMDRIVAQFMTEMDGLTKENDLIIIASTNRPDLVDPSLLRPGRFDKMIYVGLPKSVEEKTKIYKAQTLKLNLAEDVDITNLAENSHPDYSGADIYAVCSLAFTLALKNNLHNKENFTKDIVVVSMQHFKEAINKISPSLSKTEISKYEELKKKYN